MSDKQETIADIIAEMREIHVAEFQDYADRLEAAHRRELAAGGDAAKLREALDYCRDMVADLIHHIGHDEDYLEREMKELVAKCNTALAEPPRNFDAAATREALLRLRDATRNFYNQVLNSGYSKILDKYTCVKQGFPAVLDVRAAIPLANAALAAPPRNCDRPECATLDMATKTWIQEVFGPYCNGKATTGDIRTFDVWIYDTATEKEGGAE